MAGARGDALEWALALAAAPGERHALRQRPLPDGMETLLQLAGGGDGAVMATAIERSGRTSKEVIEVARFYLREVLFFPDADAYRVLGLSALASDEQIKHHHRLLQQWLHPDRPASDWDAAFAARVNAAWSQLRTPERREAYLAQATPVVHAPMSEPGKGAPLRIPPTQFEAHELDPAGRWRRRAPVLGLFGLCVILGFLAVRDMQRAPGEGLVDADSGQSEAGTDAVALQLPSGDLPEQARSAGTARRADAREQNASKLDQASHPLKRVIAALTTPSSDLRPSSVAPNASSASEMRAPSADPPHVTTAQEVTGSGGDRKAAPLLAQPGPAAPIAVVKETVAPQATQPEPVATVAPTAPARPAQVAKPSNSDVAARQAAQAEQTGLRLLAYVSGRGDGVPPIWANLAAQSEASRAREVLQATGRVTVGQPEWRIDDEAASMRASLAPRNGVARSLRVDLVWREQQWLVSKLELGS